MIPPLRVRIGDLIRATRIRLDITQRDLGRAVGVMRAYVSAVELGRANPTIDIVGRLTDALGIELEISARPPIVIGTRSRDLVHARCSAHVQRRLQAHGFECVREAEIVHGRSHGWIDLLANREVLRLAFPSRAIAMRRQLVDREAMHASTKASGRGLALINPSSRRRDWLLPSRLDGRRGPAPFRDYADAAARWGAFPGPTVAPRDAQPRRTWEPSSQPRNAPSA